MVERSWPARRALRSAAAAFFLLLAGASVALLALSRSDPWLVGTQRPPWHAWAIGSGRLKIWIAKPGLFSPDETWTASWFRGLDGQPLRWDVECHLAQDVHIVVIPLWLMAAGAAGLGAVCVGGRRVLSSDHAGC